MYVSVCDLLSIWTKSDLFSRSSDYLEPNCVQSNQWKVIERLLEISKQLSDCANILCSRETTTDSSIIPHMKDICHFFHMGEQKGLFAGLDSTPLTWRTSFNTRFSRYLVDKNLVLAIYLDQIQD